MTVADFGSWATAMTALIALPLLAAPITRRGLALLAGRLGEWIRVRDERTHAPSEEERKLYQWSKRRRLCAAIARIERLLVTDSWMSATRQLGNRLAHDQLLAELRRTPDVFPDSLDAPVIDLWSEPLRIHRARRRRMDESDVEIDWSHALPAGRAIAGGTASGATVEVLEIGWRWRRAA